MNIFTINEASCFIPDDSDREKWCGYKIIPLINRRPLRHKMLIKQTNSGKFNVHDFDYVAIECNKNNLQLNILIEEQLPTMKRNRPWQIWMAS